MKIKASLKIMAAAFVALLAATSQLQAQKAGSKTLVAYFSATGTTKHAAQQIARATGGTLYEIVPAKTYTSADLNWHNKASRSSVEMGDEKARPALKGTVAGMADYDVVYIGFPIWWDLAPRVINTFIERHNLAGKTVIPFATSGGSSIANSEKALRKAYPKLNWKAGFLTNGMDDAAVKRRVGK